MGWILLYPRKIRKPLLRHGFLQAEIITEKEFNDVYEKTPRRELTKTLKECIQYRTVIEEAFECIIKQGFVPDRLLQSTNEILKQCPVLFELLKKNDGIQTRVQTVSPKKRLLFELAFQTADFLHNSDPVLLKQCHNPDCILYFYDTSKNNSRKWCSMQACGNRSKVVKHYYKNKNTKEDFKI